MTKVVYKCEIGVTNVLTITAALRLGTNGPLRQQHACSTSHAEVSMAIARAELRR